MAKIPSNIALPVGDLVSTFLPEVVSEDPSFNASVQQFTAALQEFINQMPLLLIKQRLAPTSPNIVPLSPDLVNELGVEFRPPGYDNQTYIVANSSGVNQLVGWNDLPLYQRQNMILNACYDNAHLGTPDSVIKLVNFAFAPFGGTTQLQEWWQYGGAPYHFRILTTAPVIDPNAIAILNSAILATKPVSRWPDGVARNSGGNGKFAVGAAFFQVRVRRFPNVTS